MACVIVAARIPSRLTLPQPRQTHSCGALLPSGVLRPSTSRTALRTEEDSGRHARSCLSRKAVGSRSPATRGGQGDRRFRRNLLRLGNQSGAPDLRNIPAAIRFLGQDWRPAGGGLGDRIRRTRTAAGLSISELARVLRLDESAVRGWEVGLHNPSRRSAEKIQEWLERTLSSSPSAL